MKKLTEEFSQEKENYYLRQKDFKNLGDTKVTVSDDNSLFYVEIVNGEVESVSSPDGVDKFDIDSINSQLKSGATLGASITGEKVSTNKLQEIIKHRFRQYLFS
jgi:hypothetical protein